MSNIYTVLHHQIDRQGARDESHLAELHDTVTAHELGYSSLEEWRAAQRKEKAKTSSGALAEANRQAQELLGLIQSQTKLVNEIMARAQADASASQASDAIAVETPAPAPDPFAPAGSAAKKAPAAKKAAAKKAPAAKKAAATA